MLGKKQIIRAVQNGGGPISGNSLLQGLSQLLNQTAHMKAVAHGVVDLNCQGGANGTRSLHISSLIL